MRGLRALVLLCVLSSATSARSDTVEIQFDFGDSTMNLMGSIEIPPDGQIRSMGTTTIMPAIKTGGGATSVQTGSIQLKALTMDVSVDGGPRNFAEITGDIVATQLGTATAPFPNTQTVVFGGTGTSTSVGLSLFVSVHMDCSGPFCPGVGDFPISRVGTEPPPPGQMFTIRFGHLNTPGAATVSGTLPISVPPDTPSGTMLTGSIQLDGTEVSRTYEVPEPGFLSMLIPGLVGLAGLTALRRRG